MPTINALEKIRENLKAGDGGGGVARGVSGLAFKGLMVPLQSFLRVSVSSIHPVSYGASCFITQIKTLTSFKFNIPAAGGSSSLE